MKTQASITIFAKLALKNMRLAMASNIFFCTKSAKNTNVILHSHDGERTSTLEVLT